MKAAVYSENGGPEVIRYVDVPDPQVKVNEVLVRNQAISIEGGDLVARARLKPPTRDHIVGYSSAGEVVAVGTEVTDLRIGDKVAAFAPAGSHAQLRAVRQDHCWLLPADMDMKAAACIPVGAGTAYQALFDLGGLQAGETVLVTGAAGGVGLAAVQLAHQAGARVIGIASRDDQLRQLQDYGLDVGINYKREDVVARVRELTEGRGVNLAIDAVGGAVLQMACNSMATAGRTVMVGVVDTSPHVVTATPLMLKRQHLIGCLLGAVIHQPHEHQFVQALVERVHSGELKILIESEFSLADAAACHRHAETRGRAMGRVVILP